jgi:hypothetical protein
VKSVQHTALWFDVMFILCMLRKQNILICSNILSGLELYVQRDLLSHGGLWSGGVRLPKHPMASTSASPWLTSDALSH